MTMYYSEGWSDDRIDVFTSEFVLLTRV